MFTAATRQNQAKAGKNLVAQFRVVGRTYAVTHAKKEGSNNQGSNYQELATRKKQNQQKHTMKKTTIQALLATTLLARTLIVRTLITTTLIAAVGAVTPLTASAADPKPAVVEKKADKAARFLPFHGKLESVDKSAKSIKTGDGRTFQVMATTKITKDGAKAGTLDDAKVGDEVAGAYREGDGGKFELFSLRLGPKPEKKPAADKKK
jgi:hypothetical protein